jgi:hypothetical protein
MKQPEFVLLTEKLPAEYFANRILGRVVQNVAYLSDNYCPEDPQMHLTNHPATIDVNDSQAVLCVTHAHNSEAAAHLGELFAFHVKRSGSNNKTLQGRTVLTRTLP